MGSLVRDIRYAVRTLLRTPGFTLLVVVTLGVGIGANTAVFSVVEAVSLARLPYPDPDRLVALSQDEGGDGPAAGLDPAVFREVRAEPRLFEAAAGWRAWEPTLTGVDEPEVLRAAMVSDGMFSRVLRVRPALGRDFLPADDFEGAPDVVLLSHRAWRSRFGGDPDVVGRSLSLSDTPYTVIGVMPEGFRPPFLPDAEVWRAGAVADDAPCGHGCAGLRAVARLAPGVSLEQARVRASTLAARLAQAYPDAGREGGAAVRGLQEDVSGASARALWVLLGAVAFALLIACANVANLLLAHGFRRERELAVRLALGAERGRVLAQLLTESLVLAAAGGVAGLGLAAWGTDALLALAPEGSVPRLEGVGIDGVVLAFAAGVTVVTGILFGVIPAWRAGSGDLSTRLGPPGHRRVRSAPAGLLATLQVATAFALLVGAGLLLRSFGRLAAVDPGVRAEGVLAFDVALPASRYPDAGARRAFYAALLKGVSSLPTAGSAAAARSLPLGGDDEAVEVHVEGSPAREGGRRTARLRPVTEGYFETVGLPVLAGRPFQHGDDAAGQRVAMVNETVDRRWFPEGGALGRRIAVETDGLPVWRTVVGVVGDARHGGIREPAGPAVYLPYGQASPGAMSIVVRVDGDPLALADGVRRAVSGLDPSLAAARVRRLQDAVDSALAPERFVAALVSAFALLALLLSAVGVYGVVAHAVTLRVREMGIRSALGADGPAVRRLLVGGAMVVVSSGLALGMAGSLALGGMVSRFLYRVSPTDPLTLAVAAAILGGVAALAAWGPARGAARRDPAAVLRETGSRKRP